MGKQGVQSSTDKTDVERFDAELKEFYANRERYKFIQPRDESRSWTVRMQAKKICRSAKTLIEAVSIRDNL